MSKKFFMIIIILTALLISLCSADVRAEVPEDAAASSSEISMYVEEFEISFLKEEPEKNAVQTFSVSPNELVAIQTEKRGAENIFGENYKNITVYDSKGRFRYGYSLNMRGSVSLKWNYDDLEVMVTDTYLKYTFDPDGNVIDVSKFDADKTTIQYMNELRSPEQTVNGVEYRKTSDMMLLAFLSDGSQKVTRTDPDDNTTVIYDSGLINPRVIVSSALVIVFAVLLLLAALKFSNIRKNKNSSQNNTPKN